MEDLKDFSKYFNRDFWRAFQDKEAFFALPKKGSERSAFISNLYEEIKEKKYYPSIPTCNIDRDKGKGVTRIIPIFSIKDYCVYYYCLKKIEDKIAYNRTENTFGGWTLGGLIRKSEDDEMGKRREDFQSKEEFMAELYGVSISEFSFNPSAWARAYGDLNAKLYATASMNEYEFVAELDIANYYDSIRLDILETRIREIVDSNYADIVSLLFHFLNYWNRDINLYNKQTVGIPQDAMGDCSRILANFYLQPYDKFVFDLCASRGSKYLRYADDQFIFSNNLEELNLLIFKVSKKLNSLGLSVNQKKVEIKTTKELIDHRSFEIFDLLQDNIDRNDKEKVEKFVDHYITLLDNNGLKNIKSNGVPLLNRALFCPALGEIELSKRLKIIASLLDDDYLKNARSIHFAKIYELLADSNKDELINKLNNLSEKVIHNAFHFELLNFFNKKKIDGSAIEKRINCLENI